MNGILRDTETFGTDSDGVCFFTDGARVDQDFKDTETFCTDSDNDAIGKLVGLLLVGKLSSGLLLVQPSSVMQPHISLTSRAIENLPLVHDESVRCNNSEGKATLFINKVASVCSSNVVLSDVPVPGTS